MNKFSQPRFGSKVGVGERVLRTEDNAFITGAGAYTDDVNAAGQLYAYVLRSPHAHAAFTITDTSAALASDGVQLVLTADDISENGPLKCLSILEQVDGTKHDSKDVPLLCSGTVNYVGDAVAMVVANSMAEARIASELVEVEYDVLGAAVDTEGALSPDAPVAHSDLDKNLAFEVEMGNADDARAVFKTAPKISELKLINNRLVANYMEPRGCLAEWSDAEDRYTLTCPSQGVHGIRDSIAEACLNVKPEQLRVITPDVGGGFGTKIFAYREYPLTLIAAKKLGRPVKWLSDRNEHFQTDSHGRDNVTVFRMAMDEDGKFLALEVDAIAAMGAYLHQFGPFIPTLGASIATGVYDIPACGLRIRGVYTNTTPVDAYRGAGRPEAIYGLERLVEKCAADIGLTSDEIRRRNAIKPENMPYKTVFDSLYDTGDFTGHMDECMAKANWAGFEARRKASAASGKFRGIGMSTYIEACAFAGSEPAKVQLQQDGKIVVFIGTQSNGQGHKTAYAQFVAEQLDLDIESIEIRQGDTDDLATGGGTGASRSIPLGGVSVSEGSKALGVRIKDVAAKMLGTKAEDLAFEEGNVRQQGTNEFVSFADVAKASDEILVSVGDVQQDQATFPNGTHICELEVDPRDGTIELLSYTAVDDFGNTVNPMLLEGQVHGGIVQSVGQCLMERTIYDDEGQLLTASLMDYRLPRAADLPNFSFQTRNVASTTNAMGIKGAGEAGTIAAGPAIMNAVQDALKHGCGIDHIDMPATPNLVWEAIQNQG